MKKLIVAVLLVVVLTLGCLSFAGCTNEYFVKLDYQITSQFQQGDTIKAGSLLLKPSDPTYVAGIFSAGAGGVSNFVTDNFSITNPLINDGYDALSDYLFMGWYKEAECIRPWVFCEDRLFSEVTTLYAKWIIIE